MNIKTSLKNENLQEKIHDSTIQKRDIYMHIMWINKF